MQYADSTVCPDCRAPLGSERLKCATCGLKLTTPAAWTLWQTLQRADQELSLARRASEEPLTRGVPTPPPVALPLPVAPHYRPRMKADTVLLGLGALFILVAGSIVSTLFLGPLGLFLMAGVAAFMARVSDRKELTASTEALIAVAFGLFALAVSFFTADHGPTGLAVWSLLLLGVSLTVDHGVAKASKSFLMPKLVAAVAAAVFSLSVFTRLDWAMDWDFLPLLVGGAIAGAAAFEALRRGWRLPSLGLAIVTGFYALALEVDAIEEYLVHDSFRGLFLEGRGYPLLLVTAAILAGSHFAPPKLSPPLLGLGLAQAVFALAFPFEVTWAFTGGVVLAACAVAALSYREASQEGRVVRMVGAGAGGLALCWLLGQALPGLSTALEDLLSYDSLTPLEPAAHPFAFQWWTIALTGLLLSAALYLAASVPEARRCSSFGNLALASGLAFTAFSILGQAYATPLTMAGVLIASALALYAVDRRALWLTAALLFGAPGLAFASLPCFMGALLVVAAGFSTYTLRTSDGLARQVATFGATLYPFLALLALADELSWGARLVSGLALGYALACLAGASVQLPGRRWIGAEITGGLVLLFALSFSFEAPGTAWAALIFSIAGFSLLLRGFLRPSLAYRLGGGALLAFAWWLRLLESNVEALEAYTLPVGLAILATGSWVVYRRSALRSLPLMAPGLLLSLLPSLGLFLSDPVSLRAIILGVAALALLAWGAALKWQAPFLAGAGTLLLIALIELGPYVAEVHRWVLIGSAGLLLFAVGATWEKRVKEGKAALAYVETLR